MTRDETIKILMVIQVAYPNYKPQDKTVTVNFWTEMLSDFTYQEVTAAVKAYIRADRSGFAPSIGDVIEKLQRLFAEEDTNDAEAWQLVWKAIRSSGDYERAEENFKNLPRTIQKSVGSPGQLREWALTHNLNIEVVSSNFRKTYRIEQQREKEIQKLSPDVARLIHEKEIPQIRHEKTLSIEEQRMISENNAVPAPNDFMKRVFSVLGWDN